MNVSLLYGRIMSVLNARAQTVPLRGWTDLFTASFATAISMVIKRLKRNPLAKALRSRHLHKRVIPSKLRYSRKGRRDKSKPSSTED